MKIDITYYYDPEDKDFNMDIHESKVVVDGVEVKLPFVECDYPQDETEAFVAGIKYCNPKARVRRYRKPCEDW